MLRFSEEVRQGAGSRAARARLDERNRRERQSSANGSAIRVSPFVLDPSLTFLFRGVVVSAGSWIPACR